jgi:filamin
VPQTAEPHYVNITFNDIPIDGNPFKVSADYLGVI